MKMPLFMPLASGGLTPAHVELVKMLAAIAVEDYLREIEAGAVSTDEITKQNEAIIR